MSNKLAPKDFPPTFRLFPFSESVILSSKNKTNHFATFKIPNPTTNLLSYQPKLMNKHLFCPQDLAILPETETKAKKRKLGLSQG